jgi:AraC-like DNA-binding protein
VLLSPQILFGMPRLIYRNKTYATSSVLIQPFWEVNDEIVHSDSIDGEQLDFKVLDLISDVDYYAVRAKLFRNKYFSVADLATEVGVPVTHIEYLFNYHSSISFDEYKTHLRIQDALHLIRDGFLKTRSESELAALVGFSSVSVFSEAFFAAVGKYPSDCTPLSDPELRIGSEVLV